MTFHINGRRNKIKFKRKLLGFCGMESVKSEELIAIALLETGRVNTIDEGKKLLSEHTNQEIPYMSGLAFYFNKVGDSSYKVNLGYSYMF